MASGETVSYHVSVCGQRLDSFVGFFLFIAKLGIAYLNS